MPFIDILRNNCVLSLLLLVRFCCCSQLGVYYFNITHNYLAKKLIITLIQTNFDCFLSPFIFASNKFHTYNTILIFKIYPSNTIILLAFDFYGRIVVVSYSMYYFFLIDAIICRLQKKSNTYFLYCVIDGVFIKTNKIALVYSVTTISNNLNIILIQFCNG